ncbi:MULTISPECIES: hypothetical protein [unclassified Polaromonas]|uniref:hypothetical protein n=1 Tax=unclassified Polaromonas TaxID=2638319 RepID=UPI0018CA4AEE|nr:MULTISPECIES: hypothetical protein [unclassified Polaromonas]MBG6071811.1 hypothetical protein [Polaromonas sp. CG_9.7]MBG6113812.1 hypothetical protein [Polaromonas sp. CG_9.2]MDH6183729.1 hypothetical protein [Polaromonas sp. CG_23.6]
MNHFKPYANESDVIRIGALEIENRTDRVSLTGDVVLSRDQAGLALAKELHTLLGQVVKALQAEEKLPQTIEVMPAQVVKNPF